MKDIRVKVVETSFITGEPIACLKHYKGSGFQIVYTEDKSIAHLQVLNDSNVVAFFPYGSWLSAEIVEDKNGSN